MKLRILTVAAAGVLALSLAADQTKQHPRPPAPPQKARRGRKQAHQQKEA